MTSRRTSIHGQWSSRLAFILAATGSAVGLGNIWKFPYITGEYGGGAFVLVYLACIAFIGLPIMIAEVLLGRRGRQSPINTMRDLAHEAGRNSVWKWLGWMGVLAGFLILSYYSVIAGISLGYTVRSGLGVFEGVTGEGADTIFKQLISDPERLIAWHTVFMVMTMVVVSRGVRSGLEKAVRFLMPGLFVILVLLIGYAMAEGQFAEGLRFLFKPDFSKLSNEAVLVAMGHAFFTLSLGMGAIMMYGSYLPSKTSIAKVSIAVALMDTLVALLAGLAIFPIVFHNGMDPGAGFGLVFLTLPIAFGQMPLGIVFGTLFFVLLVFAAWSSAISLIEPAVAWLVENRGMNRVKAAVVLGVTTWALGLVTVLSFSYWAFEFRFAGNVKEAGVFDILDILTSSIMLPLGGLFIAVFVGWIMTRQSVRDELGLDEGFGFKLWYAVVRFVAPIGILVVFLNLVGLV
jgi:NSS family neurotransmitter:Na+ symporter